MRRRRGRREPGLAGNPVLIGALTVLVTFVAVMLAYNATNGLPFVPTYKLHVQAADASELTHGDEVNMGGALVGLVSSVTPTRTRSGRPVALINLQLQNSIKPLPVDTHFTVRLKGAIGLKYLEITPGHSRQGWPNGQTVPMRQESTEVDFDQVLSMFNPPTRVGVQRSTIGFGQALAGRGYDLNQAFHAFVPLFGDLGPVARNLASSHTDLAGFFQGLERYAGALAPVAATQATLFANLNTTFAALARVAVPSLQNTIADTPPNFEATIKDTPVIRPFLTDTATLFAELRPGVATLPQNAPVLASAFAIGTRNLPGTAALDRRTVTLSKTRGAVRRDPVGAAGPGPADADAVQARAAVGVPDPGPVDLQLRDAVPAQHAERRLRAREPGHAAALRPGADRRPARPRIGPVEQALHRTGERGVGPGSRQPLPEHRRARSDPRVRRRQRGLHQWPGGRRQPARQPRPQDRDDHRVGQMRRHRSRVSNFAAGVIAAVTILVVCYLVFGGSLPWAGSGFQLKATFTVETQLHLGSPVRIAGVNVGTVTGVSRVSGSSTAAVATMSIEPSGLPIHADATADIRPRLFLEGNFYVDLSPGTPSAPALSSGATLPAAQTTGPVQLDRVLSALNSPARTNLQTLLAGLGQSLNGTQTPAQQATEDPSVRGLTAAESLNKSLDYAANAFKASTLVNEALLGEQPHDLSGVVTGNEHIFAALASQSGHLQDLVTTFNDTMAALASRQQDLSTTISLLPPLLHAADNALGPLQASFAPTQRFAAELIPSVKQLAPTITAGMPWLTQSTALMSRTDLGGLLTSLTPAVQGTSDTLKSSQTLLNGSDALAKCFVHTLIPTGNEYIQDPPLTTGLQTYQELFQSAVGLASLSGNFDGNGRYVRSTAAGGADRVVTGSLTGSGPLYGNAVLAPLGTRPAYPGKQPPIDANVPCYKSAPADLNAAKTGVGP